jgi:hypothetical protein
MHWSQMICQHQSLEQVRLGEVEAGTLGKYAYDQQMQSWVWFQIGATPLRRCCQLMILQWSASQSKVVYYRLISSLKCSWRFTVWRTVLVAVRFNMQSRRATSSKYSAMGERKLDCVEQCDISYICIPEVPARHGAWKLLCTTANTRCSTASASMELL